MSYSTPMLGISKAQSTALVWSEMRSFHFRVSILALVSNTCALTPMGNSVKIKTIIPYSLILVSTKSICVMLVYTVSLFMKRCIHLLINAKFVSIIGIRANHRPIFREVLALLREYLFVPIIILRKYNNISPVIFVFCYYVI